MGKSEPESVFLPYYCETVKSTTCVREEDEAL